MDHRLEKLLTAVECLATSNMPIQERLVSAMMAMSALDAKDFPKDMRQGYSDLWAEVTSVDPKGKVCFHPVNDRANVKRGGGAIRETNRRHAGRTC